MRLASLFLLAVVALAQNRSTPLVILPNAANTKTGCIQLREKRGGTDYVEICAADALATSPAWKWPSADGSAGQSLLTSGAGVLSFGTPAGISVLDSLVTMTAGITTGNATLTAHGFFPILSGNPAQTLNGVGDWVTVPGTGDVVGPGSATNSNLAAFDGTTGKLIKDSGKAYPAGTIVGTTDSQTLTTKTLTVPILGYYTVATLPAAGTAGRIAAVTDALTAGSCTSGSGAELALCRDSGSAWASLGGGGSGATSVAALTDFLLTRTSGANLYVRGGTASQGVKAFTIADQTTCTVVAAGADTAHFYLLNGTYIIGTNTATVTCTGWTMQTSIIEFPAGSRPLWAWPVGSTANEWNSTGSADWRSIVSGESYTVGVGLTADPNETTGQTNLFVDTATTPQFTSGVVDASGSCTVGQEYHRTDTSESWKCPTTNTWVKQGKATASSKFWLTAATCSGTSATLNWNTIATLAPAAACTAGTTNTGLIRGLAAFSNSEISQMQVDVALPADWTGAVDLRFKWQTSAVTGSVVWQAATVCIANGEVNDAAWNTASTVTDAALGTTLWTNDASIAGLTTTGCAAGELMHLKIFRDPAHASDDLAATADLQGVEITTRRAQ